MDIHFTFINQSEDQDFTLAICQKNLADGTTVAWQIIDGCDADSTYEFTYPLTTCVAAEDSWGNFSDLVETEPGQQWDVTLSDDGDELNLDNQPASGPNVIEVKNCFVAGAVDANIYKDGKLLACKMGIAPQQEAAFVLDTNLWLGIVPPDIEEGDLIDPALLTTMISFMGLTKANIVATGGGSQPIEFFVEPVA